MIKNNDILDILISASNIVQTYYNTDFEVNTKKDNSPVTEIDIKVNNYLEEKLKKLLPNSYWLSEESIDNRDRLGQEFVWIVDPIDGTSKLVNRIPEFSISIGLVRNGIPFISAVINPITMEYGISNNWDTLLFSDNFSQKNNNRDLSVIVSSSEMARGGLDIFKNSKYPLKKIGSVAYKLLRIAGNKDDIYITLSPKSEWDICAGIGLVLDSGKELIRFDKKENIFNNKIPQMLKGFIAGNKENINKFCLEFPNLFL